jgi:hypothetical protein
MSSPERIVLGWKGWLVFPDLEFEDEFTEHGSYSLGIVFQVAGSRDASGSAGPQRPNPHRGSEDQERHVDADVLEGNPNADHWD